MDYETRSLFVAVKSPFTFGSWEYGDSYVKDVKDVKYGNVRTYVDPTIEAKP